MDWPETGTFLNQEDRDGMVAAGLPVGETRGVDPSSPGCFGAIGFPIAINSETVTNLNPFASS